MSVDFESSTRSTILDAAVSVFLAVGYEAASTETIAGAADVARRTLFNQFGSKELLFRAAVERLWNRLAVGAVAQEESMAVDPEVGLARMAGAIADFWDQSEVAPLVRLVIAEGERFPFLREAFSRQGRLPALAALTSYLQQLDQDGHLRIADPELAASQFVALIKDVLWWPVLLSEMALPDPARRAAAVDGAVSLFVRGYAP